MSLRDPLLERHREWLGFVRPTGLLVAPLVLVERQVALELKASEAEPWRERLEALLDEEGVAPEPLAVLREVLEWPEDALPPPPSELDCYLPALEVHLRADRAIPAGPDEPKGFLGLVVVEREDAAIDRPQPNAPDGWHASPHARFERLLRETGLPLGILLMPRRLRLLYVPRGETSAFADFPFAPMREPAGRPILAAMRALLAHPRVRAGSPERRLLALLRESRERQAAVSETLGRQVQEALAILLEGFVAAARRADAVSGVKILARTPLLYEALVTVMMRLVFLLYAEERDLVPSGPVYEQGYSLRGLFARLEDESARFPEAMEDRFGAWAQLLVLFRLVHGGGAGGEGTDAIRFVARRGTLFDPERFPLLEGRAAPFAGRIPSVSDAHVHRVLEKLLVLDGERLSYRTLDVEEIGSVYQKIMGLAVEVTTGPTLAIRPPSGRDVAVHLDLEALLAEPPGQRGKRFKEITGHDLPAAAQKAATVEALEAGLGRLVRRSLTPRPLPAGIPVLQPTDERRRTGSHYTPRALTEPVVRETLRPVLDRLGPDATPEAILDLAVLDPAMGSGAFLVEACRQLAERLVEAWKRHGTTPAIPPDETELLHAKRLVATRCLYGVDKNPLTVELAKLSLWLETLAAEHELTFLDHALRCGDSLVGLLLPQLEGVDFDPARAERHRADLLGRIVRERLAGLVGERRKVEELAEQLGETALSDLLRRGEGQVADLVRLADAIVAAFFAHEKPKERERALAAIRQLLEGPVGTNWHERLDVGGAAGLRPFHWPLVFPEVFTRPNPGFDAIVGNPPFSGKNGIVAGNPPRYPDWLRVAHEGAHGNADLCAHFFRRAFVLLREGGTFGLLATNTIAQGDTRATGLRWIRGQGGEIYRAIRRYRWPGEAAVVVAIVHVHKGPFAGPRELDGRPVERITAFLFDRGGDEDPRRLAANSGLSFIGSYVLGMGFTFDDTDKKGVANPTALMRELIAEDPKNAERIFPYIGGEEVNTDPEHRPHRWVINFEDMSEAEARQWPDLFRIVEERVKPGRIQLPPKNAWNKAVSQRWWQFGAWRKELREATIGLPRVLVISRVSHHTAFAFLPSGLVYSEQLVVFALPECAAFATLQSRAHEVWARFFASSLEDRLRYTPSDCFETFPLPEGCRSDPALEEAGRACYEHRAALMKQRREGLTTTYNRFHDPSERDPAIEELRRLHAEMDRAVLRAYGWDDLAEAAEPDFLGEDDPDFAYQGRLFWPAEFRYEVLGRLLDLNAERAAAEKRAGLAKEKRR